MSGWPSRKLKRWVGKLESYLLLLGIRHFVYCPRKWALIHLEQSCNEHLYTREKQLPDDHVRDELSCRKQRDFFTVYGMQVFSHALGIAGVCDIVEFHLSETGVPLHDRQGKYQAVPVGYEHGGSKERDAYRLQLCAQAVCIEEMLSCEVHKGYLIRGEFGRRTEILFDTELRQAVAKMFAKMHEYALKGYTPKTKPRKKCEICSLKNVCVPKLYKHGSARDYIDKKLNNAEMDT